MMSLKKFLKNFVKQKVQQKMRRKCARADYSEADYEKEWKIVGHKYITSMIAKRFKVEKLRKIFLCVYSIVLFYLIHKMIQRVELNAVEEFFILLVLISGTVYTVLILLKVDTEQLAFSIVQRIWLLNQGVLTYKDWRKIRNNDPGLIKSIQRHEGTSKNLYVSTYFIAKYVHNPDIKILWISMDWSPQSQYRTGNAVLLKGDKVFDPLLLRTYNNAEEYFRILNVEVFKEYSIDDYNIEYEEFFSEPKYDDETVSGEIVEFIMWLLDHGVDSNWFTIYGKTIEFFKDKDGNRIVIVPIIKKYMM